MFSEDVKKAGRVFLLAWSAFWLCVLVGLMSGRLSAQAPVASKPLQPIVMVDEANLTMVPMDTRQFPTEVWVAARNCLEQSGVKIPSYAKSWDAPTLLVVHGARGMVVRDLTYDSLKIAKGEAPGVSPVVWGYSFVKSQAVAVIESKADDAAILTHEALHFFAYFVGNVLGHPEQYFRPCDPLGR